MITLIFDESLNYWVLKNPSETIAENLETLKILHEFAKDAPVEYGILVHSGFRLTPVKITVKVGFDPSELNNETVTFEKGE
jgi:hypothetical protein